MNKIQVTKESSKLLELLCLDSIEDLTQDMEGLMSF